MQGTNRGKQYTFDGFEVTEANHRAFEAAKRFAANADSKPLALFGDTATGKTHLLYAIKNAIEQNSPELDVILTTTADMVSSLTSIISNGGTAEQFRGKYLQADVLLVDDIQELAGKETTQDELILLFNHLCDKS
jgi:chromosomal replication initiator protein